MAPLLPFLIIWLLSRNRSKEPAKGLTLTASSTVVVLLNVVVFFFVAGWTLLRTQGLERSGSLAGEFAVFVLTFLVPTLAVWPGPYWLAWRVFGPLRLVPIANLVLLLAVQPQAYRSGSVALMRVAYQRKRYDPRRTQANAWTAVALALDADKRGDTASADMIVQAISELPNVAPFPRRLRVVGMELLARRAIERADWAAAGRRLQLGRGRGVRFLRLLARVQGGERVRAAGLALAWALSPHRRRNLPYLRTALSRKLPTPRSVTGSNPKPVRAARPWSTHLDLLAGASEGQPIQAGQLVSLARSWERHFLPAAVARSRARGLELGVRDTGHAEEALRQALLGELEALAAVAEGPWPPAGGGVLSAELINRGRHRLFQAVAAYSEGFPDAGSISRPLKSPLEEWEDWVRFRAAVHRLERNGGAESLATAWHNGLRLTAWNWPVYLERAKGEDARWACRVMHTWVADLAERLRDEEAAKVTRENARLAAAYDTF